jgi:ribosomal protein L37AE/L43A
MKLTCDACKGSNFTSVRWSLGVWVCVSCHGTPKHRTVAAVTDAEWVEKFPLHAVKILIGDRW